jgi:pSer/pThr/pTyr-binding forkhead associated (FHA) protein
MALFLITEMGRDRAQTWELPAGEITVGRSDTVLVLPNVSVSRLHARIDPTDSGHKVLDMGGENGVLVNDVAVRDQELNTGDVLIVGKYKLEYIRSMSDLKGPRLQQVTLLSAYPNHRAGTSGDSTFALSPELRQKMQAQDKLRECAALVAVQGKRAFKPGASTLTIGPGGQVPASVFLARSPVAELAWESGGHVLRKTSLLGKVTVNGGPPDDKTPLRPGDRVQVGADVFTYELLK